MYKMIDYSSTDPEELSNLHKQKMEEVKLMMDNIVTNPSNVSVDDIRKVIDYSITPTEND
jgi:hypothetical protein